jgi:putative redox protein
MIKLKSLDENFQCCIEAGKDRIIVDSAEKYGGTGLYIQPFELLEAAVAACMNITVRSRAERAGIKLTNVQTTVKMNCSDEGKLVFEYDYFVPGDFDDETNKLFADVINGSWLRQLMTYREIEFKKVEIK